MKSIKEHREKIIEIANYAFSYSKSVSDNSLIDDSNNNKSKQLLRQCFDGMKIAQGLIINEIKIYQEEKRKLFENAKSIKDKKLQKQLKTKIDKITYRICTYSHIADTMGWHLIGGQLHVAKINSQGEKGIKDLTTVNLESAIKFAEKENANRDCFALITDITHMFQIGDILLHKNGKISFIELKEGELNSKISKFADQIFDVNNTKYSLDFDINKKTARQIKRNLSQRLRMLKAQQIIQNEHGPDPRQDRHLDICTPVKDLEYYYNSFEYIQNELVDNAWTYELLEGCLHIFSCNGKMTRQLLSIFISNGQIDGGNYITINFKSIIEDTSEPLFAKPFPRDFIVDILTDEITIIMSLDLDALIRLFSLIGLNVRWLTSKETMQMKQKNKNSSFIVVNNCAIVIEKDNEKMILGRGILGKIFFDNIFPSSIGYSFTN